MRYVEREHNGVVYDNFYGCDAQAIACVGTDRLIIDGQVKFCLVRGSVKFEPEFQVSICVPKDQVRKEKRNGYSADKWDVIEIDLPLSEAKKLLASVSDHLARLQSGDNTC